LSQRGLYPPIELGSSLNSLLLIICYNEPLNNSFHGLITRFPNLYVYKQASYSEKYMAVKLKSYEPLARSQPEPSSPVAFNTSNLNPPESNAQTIPHESHEHPPRDHTEHIEVHGTGRGVKAEEGHEPSTGPRIRS